VKKQTENWLKIAKYELSAAEALLKNELYLKSVEHYHAALEKLLKGLITSNDQEAPRIHDLLRLASLALVENLQSEITDLVNSSIEIINSNFDVEQIILFGSYAKGTANADSDVDIAVISPQFTKKSIYGNVKILVEKTNLRKPYLQLVAFSSKDFDEETFINPDFIREIKRTGKVVYKQAN